MNTKKTLWMVILALLCVPASGVGIVLGFLVGCVIVMILQGIFAPGQAYDYYSVGTPVGGVSRGQGCRKGRRQPRCGRDRWAGFPLV